MYDIRDSPLGPTFIINWSTAHPDGSEEGVSVHWMPPGTEQSQRQELEEDRRDKVYGDSERRALPSSGRQQQVRRGPPGTIWVTCPPFLLFQGVAAAELKPEWVRSKSAPQSQVMSTYFVLSLLKKPNTELNICFAPGFLSFCVRPGWGEPKKDHLDFPPGWDKAMRLSQPFPFI